MESSSQNLYSFKLLANDIENFPNFLCLHISATPVSIMWSSPLKVKMLTMQGWLGSLQVSREIKPICQVSLYNVGSIKPILFKYCKYYLYLK